MITARESIPAADALLDRQIPVLDHGFIALTNYMGSDTEICRAARTCTSGENTKTVNDDRALIRRLMRDGHTSPFEFVEFTFLCQMPIFVARQWIRHRTANVNEMSGRYGEMPELAYIPEVQRVVYQDPVNKQGSGSPVSTSVAVSFQEDLRRGQESAFSNYHHYLGKSTPIYGFTPAESRELSENGGISRELARINLPLSTYTKWMWKIDLHNLFHFLELRLHSHAQWEIRQYAQIMTTIVRAVCPLAWKAFEDFRLYSMTLNGLEVLALQALMSASLDVTNAISRFSNNEFAAFVAKLDMLGMNKFIPAVQDARLRWEGITAGVGGAVE